jgi:hypothetical protein
LRKSAAPEICLTDAAAKFSPVMSPLAIGPSCTLIGVTSIPIIAPPIILA